MRQLIAKLDYLKVSTFKSTFRRDKVGMFVSPGNAKGGSIPTIGLLFDWFGISCMTTDNSCFYLQ